MPGTATEPSTLSNRYRCSPNTFSRSKSYLKHGGTLAQRPVGIKRGGGLTGEVIGHEYAQVCDGPVVVVQQTWVDLDGEGAVLHITLLHQRLVVLRDWWVFREKNNREEAETQKRRKLQDRGC